jgi:hypothetical protein
MFKIKVYYNYIFMFVSQFQKAQTSIQFKLLGVANIIIADEKPENCLLLDIIPSKKFQTTKVYTWLKENLSNRELATVESFRTDLQIWVEMPVWDKSLSIEYVSSDFFQFLREKEDEALKGRKNQNWKGRNTSCLFVKNGRVLVWGTQYPDLHTFENENDEFCIREKMKNDGSWKPGDSYEICPGCSKHNHGEAVAIKKAEEMGILEDLKDSICYDSNHWWMCGDCQQLVKKYGVKKVFLDLDKVKELFGLQVDEFYN